MLKLDIKESTKIQKQIIEKSETKKLFKLFENSIIQNICPHKFQKMNNSNFKSKFSKRYNM